MKKITVSLTLVLVLIFSLTACAVTPSDPPLPPSATLEEITALKAETLTTITCLYAASSDSRYTADSIFIDGAKEEFLLYESAMIDRFAKLENALKMSKEKEKDKKKPQKQGLDAVRANKKVRRRINKMSIL